MTLNGWQRLGVVLSALWLFMVLAFTSIEYYSADKYRFLSSGESNVFVYWAGLKFIDPYELRIGENLNQLSEREQLDILRKREESSNGLSLKLFFGRLFAASIGPIVGSWFLVYAVIFIVGWVRKGFVNGTKGT